MICNVNVLDPLLDYLAKFENSVELSTRIMELFHVLDSDDSGHLTSEEMIFGKGWQLPERDTERQRNRGIETQKCRDTATQRHRDTETQRHR